MLYSAIFSMSTLNRGVDAQPVFHLKYTTLTLMMIEKTKPPVDSASDEPERIILIVEMKS